MKVYYLPLEPVDKRYTAQWYKWFKEVFEEEGIEFEYIDGKTVESNVGSKYFLDMKATFVWKFEQLKRLFKRELKDGDVVFIPDGEFPGIEAIEYFKRFYGVDVKVVQIWHAGTYDYWDLTRQVGLTRIGKHLEEVWMDMAGLIFVATQCHKDLILKERMVDKDKVKVTGLPADVRGLGKYEKERKEGIAFTGRLSIEKGYDVVCELRKKGFEITATQEQNLSKEQYYELLGGMKVVFAPSRQETFGYGVVEGMAMNCIPVVPDGLSFTDYVPSKWRYKDNDEMVEMLRKAMECEGEEMYKFVEKYQYEDVISRMIKCMEVKL